MIVRRIVLLLAFVPAALLAKSYGEYDIAPAPKWIDTVQPEIAYAVPAKLARYGIYDILSDHQVRFARDGGTSQYYRRVRKALTSSGVQNASELSIDFDPSFQRLVLHEVAIIRGGKRTPALDPSQIRVIEKEDESDDGIYDGHLTALVFLRDVRPGDVIDWSWSIDGSNPILRGHYADEYDLRSDVPSRLIRHRLVWNGARPVQTRGHDPARTGDALVWEAHDVSAVNLEDALPSWYEPWDTIDVSDYASWREVTDWAIAMFAVDDDSRAAVHELAQKIRTEHPDDPVTAAIRFVQDDIRYLGLEIGRNSHEPRQPSDVLEQRWGDCKEKALLLSLVLRELGVTADPALVNTKMRHRLDTRLPSPFAFDHVVVRVLFGGKTYWIDPTIANQGGTLTTIDTPNDARALVVSSDPTALTRIQTQRHGRTVIDEIYSAQDANAPTTLVVRTTYSGGDADDVRNDLASMDADEFARDRINRLAADHPSIAATAPPKVDDDRLHDVVTIVEHYTVRNLWTHGDWTYYPRAIEPSLDKPKRIIRSMPLAFDYPLDIVERATFRFPGGASIDADPVSHTSPAFAFRFTPTQRDRTLTLEYTLRSLRDSVPAAQVASHLEVINDVEDDLGCTVTPAFRDTAQMRLMPGGPIHGLPWVWTAVAVVVILVAAIVLVTILKLFAVRRSLLQ